MSGSRWEGSIVAGGDGRFATVADGGLVPLKVPRSARAEVRVLLGLRDAATGLLELEAASVEDSDDLDAVRTELRRRYEAYVGRYGPLGRFSLRRTGRTNDAGQDTYARIVPRPIRILRADPFAPLVLALEQFDDQDQTASPAAILTRRVVVPTPEVLGVETPADAIAVSLDRTGHIDLDLIAGLLGMPADAAREALGGSVFTDPTTGRLVNAPEYLSGDVRTKLEAATGYATLIWPRYGTQ
jgi:N12 class adenine-specific DNA methylase